MIITKDNLPYTDYVCIWTNKKGKSLFLNKFGYWNADSPPEMVYNSTNFKKEFDCQIPRKGRKIQVVKLIRRK